MLLSESGLPLMLGIRSFGLIDREDVLIGMSALSPL
jgi:hypothetical protein